MTIDPQTTQYILKEIRDLEESIKLRDDLLIAVIRFHLLAENLIERFITAKLPKGNVLNEQARLSFAQKLGVADSMGVIEPELITALSRLNALRNKCAHTKGRQVSLRDLDAIGEPLKMEFSSAKPDPHETEVNQVGLAARLFWEIQFRFLSHLAPIEEPSIKNDEST